MSRGLILFIFLYCSAVCAQGNVELSGKQLDQLDLGVEGVYFAQGPELETKEGTRKIEFYITILKNVGRQDLSLTIASKRFGNIIYFASNFRFMQGARMSEIDIDSYGVSMDGTRQNLFFTLDTETETIRGKVLSSLLKIPEAIEVEGKKVDKLNEVFASQGDRKCGPDKVYRGLFEGVWGDRSNVSLTIQQLNTDASSTTLTARIGLSVLVLFHRGVFDPTDEVLVFTKDLGYGFRGQARKLILACDQDDENWILRGVHIASNGQTVSNIVFKKKK